MNDAALLHLAVALVPALFVAQLVEAALLWRLRGEVSRSTPVELTEQVRELREELSVFRSVFNPEFLVRLRQNDGRQQDLIDQLQREINGQREILARFDGRFESIENKLDALGCSEARWHESEKPPFCPLYKVACPLNGKDKEP
jgi:hypothetical protein